MLGLSRALLTFLIALVASQFVGLAWVEAAADRPFSCDGLSVAWFGPWYLAGPAKRPRAALIERYEDDPGERDL